VRGASRLGSACPTLQTSTQVLGLSTSIIPATPRRSAVETRLGALPLNLEGVTLARIFPEHLHTGPASERAVHRALSQLPDDYLVVHGAGWLGRPGPGRMVRDGEADFVVAHAERGILILEVKGGAIDYEASTHSWTSTSRAGRRSKIKDPFEQATTSKHLLMEKLTYHEKWPPRRIRFCHAVCFPDVSVDSGFLLNAPRPIVLDANDLNSLESSLDRAFSFFDDGQAPGDAAIGVVRAVLAPTLSLRRSLGSAIRGETEQILNLTTEQVQGLDLLRNQRRAVIAGCAGSGKTVLAVEKARQLSAEGLRVLLLCYNKRLAERLGQEVEDCESITAVHFHRLAIGLIRQAAIELDWDTEDPDFWEKTVPEKMVDAIADIPDRYDAVIVDEGQDFAASWWSPLQWLLADEENGIFYVFMDDNQRLYDRPSEIPISTEPFLLTRNCRNTRLIGEFVNSYYRGDTQPECRGPAGREVEIHRYSSPETMSLSIEQRLGRLVTQEGVAPNDIAVLTAHRVRGSKLRGLAGNGFTLETGRQGSNSVELETIYSFKGLEKPVIALAELGEVDAEKIDSLMYVGSSRALNHLIVFAPAELEIPAVGPV
jgi:hypothetical protein